MFNFLDYLREERAGKIIAVYPGRFQMPHKGHKYVYDLMTGMFGSGNVYVATSNKVELPKSPFDFREKRMLLQFAGLPGSHIIQTKVPNLATEIIGSFPTNTVLVIAAGAKVQSEENRFPFKAGGYYQPYDKNKNNLEGYTKHAYVIFIPTQTFRVMGKEAHSASELRAQFATLDYEAQKIFMHDLYGRYDKQIHELLRKKLHG